MFRAMKPINRAQAQLYIIEHSNITDFKRGNAEKADIPISIVQSF